MNERTKQMTLAFLRSIGNQCDVCRRGNNNCMSCPAHQAKMLIRDITTDGKVNEIDYSIATRMAKIEDCLRKGDHDLLSVEIDISGIASKQLKRWTLQHMMNMGRIGRRFDQKKKAYRYFLKQNRKKTTK